MARHKFVLFVISLLPLVYLIVRIALNALGPDPGKEVVLELGYWALCFLWLSLAVSPLKRITGITTLMRYRRMLGLFCWFYASLHFLAVAHFMLGWSLTIFAEEFVERPYMALGIVAWCLLVPLGLSSNKWAIRRLGQNWKRLHLLVYLIAILALLHFTWLVRSDYGEVLLFACLLVVLFGERLWLQIKRFKPIAN